MGEKALISVIVLTFNHGEYLARTLAGIEAQEFDGDIQVVIHDDASTDQTPSLCVEFAAASRHEVTLILQAKNKYSRKLSLWPEIFAACKGDYIALCEGDDYWTTPLKLANQYTALDYLKHVDLCFHRVTGVHYQTAQMLRVFGDQGEEPKILHPTTVIEGDGGFVPTPSIMFRRSAIATLPAWFYTPPPVGDYFLQVFGSLRGGALYLPMNAAAYRQGDPQSWSQRNQSSLKPMNAFVCSYVPFLGMLKNSLPAEFKPSVDKLMEKIYLDFCIRCFRSNEFEDMQALLEAVECASTNSKESAET
jgi:glycosyltransferase involved in cell wall biosynthesis